eukprot:1142555-Pelagomonas_calceolata.AAC.2
MGGGLKLPKALQALASIRPKTLQKWKPGKRCTWPFHCDDLFNMFSRSALPSMGAQVCRELLLADSAAG